MMPLAPDDYVNLAEAASIELPFNVEEALIREESNRTSHHADDILDQEFVFPFLNPASTLEIQGSNNSHQGAQGSCSLPSLSEQLISRAAPSVNHTEFVDQGGGVQPANISYGRSTVNASVVTSVPNNSMGQNPQTHFPLISDPFDYELEKLRRENENDEKIYEETTSKMMAELERKMAEVRSEYARESQDVEAAFNANTMKEEAIKNWIAMSSLLANGFNFKCTDKSAATDVPAVRARSFQHSTAPPRSSITAAESPIPNPSGPLLHFPRHTSTQPRPQQASVQTNMNSTAPPRPTITAAESPFPNPSGPLLNSPRCTTPQPRLISQQTAVQSNTHVNSATPLRPSVTSAESPIPNLSGHLSRFLHNKTQPRPISRQPAVQSTAFPRPSVRAEAVPLHSPRATTPQQRLPPLISNLNPYTTPSFPSGHGTVRSAPPHLQAFRSRASNSAAATTTTYPRRLDQEQQQEKSKQ